MTSFFCVAITFVTLTSLTLRLTVFSDMTELRLVADELEALVGKEYWSLPTYAELLYSVN